MDIERSGPAGRPRVPGYDLLRLAAIVAVITIHVLMHYRGLVPGTSPIALIDKTLHFAVPVFFFVSGALIWGRAGDRRSAELGRRAMTLLPPYLAWSGLYLLLTTLRPGAALALRQVPGMLLFGKSWYHLYFVPVLFLYYLLTPAFAPFARRQPEILVIAAYLLRIAGTTAIAPVLVHVADPYLTTFVTVATVHLSDVALGAWFAVRREHVLPVLRRIGPAMALAGLVLLIGRSAGALTAGMPPVLSRGIVPLGTALVVLGSSGAVFAISFRPDHAARVSSLGRLVFGVYLSHPLFVFALAEALQASRLSWLWGQTWMPVVSTLGVTLAAFTASATLASRPHLAWLVGLRGRTAIRTAVTSGTGEGGLVA